jgi:hypothetical protein
MTILTSGVTEVEFRATTLRRSEYTTEDEVTVERMDYPIEAVGTRDVILDPARMTVDRAYSYELDGIDYVAIKRADGRLDFYELPARK